MFVIVIVIVIVVAVAVGIRIFFSSGGWIDLPFVSKILAIAKAFLVSNKNKGMEWYRIE